MRRERQENLEKYRQEMSQPEVSLENAQLCSDIAKYWATEDNEVVFWKKKELEIRQKFYGKNSPELTRYYDELATECLKCTKYKSSLTVCKKALKIKEDHKASFQELLNTYAVMMSNYVHLEEYEKGLELGRAVLNDDRMQKEGSSESLNQVIIELAYSCKKLGLKEEMKKRIEFGLDLAYKSCGRDSALTAEMYVEKADELVRDKDEKKLLLMEALTIFLDQYDINDPKIGDTFFRLWWCWREESDDAIGEAMRWLESNMEVKYYNKVKKWREQKN